jgi:hypothetical protein
LRELTTLPLTLETVHHTIDVCVEWKVTRKNYSDRQFTARMLRANISRFVTENVKDFQSIESISAINPFGCQLCRNFKMTSLGG